MSNAGVVIRPMESWRFRESGLDSFLYSGLAARWIDLAGFGRVRPSGCILARRRGVGCARNRRQWWDDVAAASPSHTNALAKLSKADVTEFARSGGSRTP
jgi:hypothetical protein